MSWEGQFQQTITRPIKFSGIALHTGKEVEIKCFPAAENSGIIFRRVDLKGKPEIKADPFQVISTKRCTSLGLSDKEDTPCVHTVEHLMAAVWAMGVDNLIIEIDNAETPVGDGSALPFIKLIKEAGLKNQRAKREVFEITNPLWARKNDMYIVILPYEGFKISYTLDYEHPVIGTLFFEYESGEDLFIKEVAPARTFGFEREVEALHRRGLALGGNLDNAVLIGDEKTINPLRFPDEFIRHKVLDVIGDMALNGYLKGHIIAVKSGHYLHVELAKLIKKQIIQGGSNQHDVY